MTSRPGRTTGHDSISQRDRLTFLQTGSSAKSLPNPPQRYDTSPTGPPDAPRTPHLTERGFVMGYSVPARGGGFELISLARATGWLELLDVEGLEDLGLTCELYARRFELRS